MTEGKIVSWIKSEGDKLSKGESIVVVESDKADMDVETFYDGYLASIMVEEGGVAPVGSAITLLTEIEIEQARSKAQSSSSSSETLDSDSPPAQQEALDSESGSSCVGVRNEKSSASHDYWIFVVHGFKLEAIMLVEQGTEGLCNSECNTTYRARISRDVAEFVYKHHPSVDKLANVLCKDLP
ncbi:dihydrolipoyllysine-residue acetyltransferase component 5 of pyruvate dehydrogenase complex, chloroplastic-like [Asparagus officinalis]|uniref:dihydrolipoyllysine-residue acetyltransferase component 5 of pyruvate dehydrogenase complex, chloroplastic-like n=1 Tax=Asparagus officinalis TaxID=4686 RepID=UPI00098E37C7|nr:dihydrolipoyllysine-residue acetyltransferase component 5 of pyruvate dehydrogenase complex, chloroplastic-like [Asparagus officinalis]